VYVGSKPRSQEQRTEAEATVGGGLRDVALFVAQASVIPPRYSYPQAARPAGEGA
jgi:hypothetical protein